MNTTTRSVSLAVLLLNRLNRQINTSGTSRLAVDAAHMVTTAAWSGGAGDVCCRLAFDHEPLIPLLDDRDRELHDAALSLAAALWHLEAGELAGRALRAARGHLNAARGQRRSAPITTGGSHA